MHPGQIAQDMFAFPDTLGELVRNRKEIAGFLEKYILSRKGADITPLKEAVHRMFDYDKFHDSDINFACMTFNVTRRQAEAYYKDEMTRENAEDIIIASASCYPAFPMMEMNGDQYIDGGYWDNLPVDLAAKMGAEKILAFDVEGPGVILPVSHTLDVFTVKPMLPIQNFLDFLQNPAYGVWKQAIWKPANSWRNTWGTCIPSAVKKKATWCSLNSTCALCLKFTTSS